MRTTHKWRGPEKRWGWQNKGNLGDLMRGAEREAFKMPDPSATSQIR